MVLLREICGFAASKKMVFVQQFAFSLVVFVHMRPFGFDFYCFLIFFVLLIGFSKWFSQSRFTCPFYV